MKPYQITRFCLGLSALSLVLTAAFSAEINALNPSERRERKETPLAEKTTDGFRVPSLDPHFTFPKDHGAHPDFKIEWWYLTGHLFGPNNERFGYQVTFFRRAGAPSNASPTTTPRFRSDEIYLLHVALLDAKTQTFLHQERLARSGWEAHSSSEKLDLKIADSSLKMPSETSQEIHLEAHIRNEVSLSLILNPAKPLVTFGDHGVSRKGDSDTAASWYLTFPRLQTTGELQIGNRTIPLHGETWMDHEISSSQLTDNQTGWDWAGIQLDDGREIMIYRLRCKDGTIDPASTLTWVDRSGNTTAFTSTQFSWEAQDHWRSPHSQANYPLPVILRCPDPQSGKMIELTLQPLARDQELGGVQSGLAYWEGACQVLLKQKPAGSAYVELTGYSSDLSKRLK